MKRKYDSLTYRHPRTLEEAFGPYERWGEIIDPNDEAYETTLIESLMIYVGAAMLAFFLFVAISGANQ
jgi:hypothetical protein